MISIAAPTKPKVDREAFPIPGPYKNKKKYTSHNLIRYTCMFIKLTSTRTKKTNILHEIQPSIQNLRGILMGWPASLPSCATAPGSFPTPVTCITKTDGLMIHTSWTLHLPIMLHGTLHYFGNQNKMSQKWTLQLFAIPRAERPPPLKPFSSCASSCTATRRGRQHRVIKTLLVIKDSSPLSAIL